MEGEAYGCGSKICTQNGTLVNGNGLILTHTHICGLGSQWLRPLGVHWIGGNLEIVSGGEAYLRILA